MFNRKKKINYLDIVPVRNVQELTEGDGRITLLIPKFKSERMRKWLIPAKRSKDFRIHLDPLGSKVWRLVDGKRTVGDICNSLIMADGEVNPPDDQLEIRITKFFTQLLKHGFVRFDKTTLLFPFHPEA